MRCCAALFISAPASGQGKTTVTAALARYYRDQGLHVRVFKTGPDFLDPMILECASGKAVYQLDLWMGGEQHCRQLLYEAADKADVILIEGVMGLFDGDRCSADLAMLYNIPVLAVIDASAMAQTFAAIAHGLASYRPELRFAGVFANRVAGDQHYQMLCENLPTDIAAFGWLPRDPDIALPERHLGLVQGHEIQDLDERMSKTSLALNEMNIPLPPTVTFIADVSETETGSLAGVRIAIAHDAAFAFLYRANVELLSALGAELIYFSPLEDDSLPDADALYLPGGYPELHLESLTANTAMKTAIQSFHAAGYPIVAECGGMLYLLESLSDSTGQTATMLGILPGHASIQGQLANIGLHSIDLPEGTLRGHTFHYSKMECSHEPIAYSRTARHHGRSEPIYRQGRLTASYLHSYFPSNPAATAQLFLP